MGGEARDSRIRAVGEEARYSAAVATGGLIVTSGHLGVSAGADPVDFERQAEVAFERLIGSIEAAGGSVETVLRVNGFLAALEHFDPYDAVYARFFSSRPLPARRTVVVAGFKPPILVEVDAIAISSAGIIDEDRSDMVYHRPS